MSDDNNKNNNHFDDFSKMCAGAFGNMFNAKNDFSKAFFEKMDLFLNQCNIVKRDEFLALRDTVNNMLAEQESLKMRIKALEENK